MRRKSPTLRQRFELLEGRRVLAAHAFAQVDVLELGDAGWYLNEDHFTNHDVATEFVPVVSGDFTRDGVSDVLGQADGQWWLQANDGGQLFGVPWGELSASEAAFLGEGDFNDDGWLDVLLWDSQSGDFLLEAGSQNGFTRQVWGNWTTDVAWSDFTIQDVDNDGRLDVLANESSGNWWVAKNSGGRFLNHHWGRFQDFNWQTIVDGDFNGDGFADAAALGQDNTWWVWSGSTDGFGLPEYRGHWKMADVWSDISSGDLNVDGRDDLIGRREDGTLWVGSSTADDRFQTWSWGSGWIASAEWTNVELLDVDQDGLIDQVGQAKDGTLWIAQNMGGKFQNHYWSRLTGSSGFVDYVSSFEQSERLTLARLFPGATDVFQPREKTVQTQTGLREMDERVRVSLNDDGFLVIQSEEPLLGIDFISASGSLRPVVNHIAEPFEFLLENLPTQVTMGSLTNPVDISDPVVLGVRFDPTKARDLLVSWGGPEFDGPAFVAPELFDPDTEITTFQALSVTPSEIAADNVTAYNLVATNWQNGNVVVQPSAVSEPVPTPAPIPTPALEPAPVPTPTPTLFSEEVVGELRDGKLVVIASDLKVAGIDLVSEKGLLVPVPDGDPAPFAFFLSNTANQITWGNLGSTFTIDGELVTEAGYTGDPTSGDLRAAVGIDSTPVYFSVT